MKFIHLSDLHLGKRVNEFSMLDDQAYILNKILRLIEAEAPQAVVIAGDIYDKNVAPVEAVQLFDDFLCQLSCLQLQVFVISGNHDSPERLSFGGRLMTRSGIHLAPVYDGSTKAITLEDSFGPLHFYMLPFLKPAQIRRFFPDASIESCTDALRAAIAQMEIDPSVRNVLVAHQFVTGALRSDSEDISLGGADQVDGTVFDCFDYVALGHLHGPQSAGRETIRYCGTPLKYSFSEKDHKKSVTVVNMGEKGHVEIRAVPLAPRHDLREVEGRFEELCRCPEQGSDDYLRLILTDEQEIPDAIRRLRAIYPHLMRLDYNNSRSRSFQRPEAVEELEAKSELDLFAELYEKQNGQRMNPEQLAYSAALFEKIREGMS